MRRPSEEGHEVSGAARCHVLSTSAPTSASWAVGALCRPWSRDEERAAGERLAAARRAGDSRALARERDAFVRHNMRLVISIASRHRSRRLDVLDRIQEGSLGLLRAVDKFDPGRGVRFGTYATWWIRQAISRAAIDTGSTIRRPVHVVEAQRRVASARRRLVVISGREPTAEELASDLGWPIEKTRAALESHHEPVSLDAPAREGDDRRAIADVVAADEGRSALDELIERADAAMVRRRFATLSGREARVLRMRFGLDDEEPRTLADVGAAFALSREGARQIETKALARLRAGAP